MKRTVYSLLAPGGAIVATVAVLVSLGIARPAMAAVAASSYIAVGAGVLLAWRFHSLRVLAAVVCVGTADLVVRYSAGGPAAAVTLDLVALLLPLDLALLSFVDDHGWFSQGPGTAGMIAAQVVVGAIVCRPDVNAAAALEHAFLAAGLLAWTNLPQLGVLAFLLSAAVLLGRYLVVRNPIDSGFAAALAATFLALHARGAMPASGVYFTTASLVLAVAVVENSYLLAYHDQLTGLPARRAFNHALLGLPETYAIAVADVDHFKRFNDTFGHDTGDQVLRMVASRLGQVGGGGKAFRWGGEEFVLVFSGSTAEDVLPHLEELRQAVEETTFIVRAPDRRKHTPEERGRRSRQPEREVSVTISLGVADPGKRILSPSDVLKLADAALYAAKDNGRNRIEAARPARGRATAARRKPVPAREG